MAHLFDVFGKASEPGFSGVKRRGRRRERGEGSDGYAGKLELAPSSWALPIGLNLIVTHFLLMLRMRREELVQLCAEATLLGYRERNGTFQFGF